MEWLLLSYLIILYRSYVKCDERMSIWLLNSCSRSATIHHYATVIGEIDGG
jgi:hypothetical protein